MERGNIRCLLCEDGTGRAKSHFIFKPTICVFVCLCVSQRQGKVQETQMKCTKARNDYLLNLAAANVTMNKYYLEDICTLIDVSLIYFSPSILCLDTHQDVVVFKFPFLF